MKDLELSLHKKIILECFKLFPDITIKEVSDLLEIPEASLRFTVQELIKAGYIVAENIGNNRKKYNVVKESSMICLKILEKITLKQQK